MLNTTTNGNPATATTNTPNNIKITSSDNTIITPANSETTANGNTINHNHQHDGNPSIFTKEYITEFESHSDRMGVNRRITLISLSVSQETLNDPIFDEIRGMVDECISYYTELLAMLHTSKERLSNSIGGVR